VGAMGGGAGCRVQGSGFRVQGAGFRVRGSGFRVQGHPQDAVALEDLVEEAGRAVCQLGCLLEGV